MKIAIKASPTERSQALKKELTAKLQAEKLCVVETDPNLVITIGGDGTLLEAVGRYKDNVDKIRFVGVHTGHLGFYTDWLEGEIDDLVASLVADNGQAVSYPMLEIIIKYYDDPKLAHHFALNEAALKKFGPTLVTELYIGDQLFENFRGDGLCFSTPSGSTAYNKSLGGAIVDPTIDAMQVAEIASINNRVFRTLGSPMILPPNKEVTLKTDSECDFLLTVDSESLFCCGIETITFRLADKRVAFAKYRHKNFWKRVKTAFIN